MKRQRKTTDMVKTVYVKQNSPYSMICFSDNIDEIKAKLKRWCIAQKINYADVKGFESCGKYHSI